MKKTSEKPHAVQLEGKSLYDIPEGHCLCQYAEGPCAGHALNLFSANSEFTRKPVATLPPSPPGLRGKLSQMLKG